MDVRWRIEITFSLAGSALFLHSYRDPLQLGEGVLKQREKGLQSGGVFLDSRSAPVCLFWGIICVGPSLCSEPLLDYVVTENKRGGDSKKKHTSKRY